MATISMGILAVACVLIVLAGLSKALALSSLSDAAKKRSFRIAAIILTGWLLFVAIVTINGFASNFNSFPPRPLLLVGLPVIAIILWSFTKTGRAILVAVPPHWLVYMQSFRIAVEIILWMAFMEVIIPKQMTFEGRNWDVLTGILAIPFGYLLQRRRSPFLQVVFNCIGIGLLLNIVIISILSMPTPARVFFDEPTNTVVGTFPFIYLPTVMVVLAAGLHILSLRQVWILNRISKKNNVNVKIDEPVLQQA
jgi:hypothetical protein